MTQININNDQVLSDVNSEIKVIASLVANILTDEFGNEFLEKLRNDYNDSTLDFFTLFEDEAEKREIKLPRYFISYGKTKEQIISELSLQSDDSIKRVIEIIENS